MLIDVVLKAFVLKNNCRIGRPAHFFLLRMLKLYGSVYIFMLIVRIRLSISDSIITAAPNIMYMGPEM